MVEKGKGGAGVSRLVCPWCSCVPVELAESGLRSWVVECGAGVGVDSAELLGAFVVVRWRCGLEVGAGVGSASGEGARRVSSSSERRAGTLTAPRGVEKRTCGMASGVSGEVESHVAVYGIAIWDGMAGVVVLPKRDVWEEALPEVEGVGGIGELTTKGSGRSSDHT